MVSWTTFHSKEEWKNHRNSIGGSDAGAIMGRCKWRDNLTLWREKCGYTEPEDISDRPFVQYGINMEPHIREAFKCHHPEFAVGYEEYNMWTNDRIPFAHASLDGWLETYDGRFGVLEIKTTEITSKAKWDEWDGRMPDTYYCQLLHYLNVTNFDFAILVAELKVHRMDDEIEWHTIERRIEREEVQKDIDALEKKEREFWQCVASKTEPPRILPSI